MRKLVVWSLFLMFVSVNAFALTPREEKEARYQEMKKIKDAQRAARDAEKANPELAAKKAPGFWEREGERSGLGSSGSRMGSFLRGLNPVPFLKDQQGKYNARKEASQAQHASDRAREVAAPQSAVAATAK